MSTIVMPMIATIGEVLARWLVTVFIVLMMSVRAMVIRFSRSRNYQPRLMPITRVGVVRTASNHRVKRDCDCRQDGDDAVKHEF